LKSTIRRRAVSILLLFSFIWLSAGEGFAAAEEPDSTSSAAPAAEEKTIPHNDRLFADFFRDEGKMWSAPFRPTLKNTLIWGAVLAATGALIANDEGIYQHFKEYQGKHPWVDEVSPKVTVLGDFGVASGIAGLFFLDGVIFRDAKARETGILAIEALLHTGILVQVMKHLAGRKRPEVPEIGKDGWAGPSGFFKRYSENFSSYDSFPSGHTITAWSLATVISAQYRESPGVGIVCYSLATLTGLSRVTEDKHWLSDVMLGAALGYAIGKMVVRNERHRLQVAPSALPRGAGVALTYEF
jgi:membrane-associated phospholipid phosphatase